MVDGVSAWVVDDGALAYVHEVGSIIELDSFNGLWVAGVIGPASVV